MNSSHIIIFFQTERTGRIKIPMKKNASLSYGWNPWHGCVKISPGCANCYVYRQDKMYGSELKSNEFHKNADFNLPVKKKRDKSYKIPSGSIVFTCFTSDFLLDSADKLRDEAWDMIKIRKDLMFFFFTKRIDRFTKIMPADWNNGYNNVIIGCSVENQKMADYRLPIFNSLPIKYKAIIAAPLLEKINLRPYLNNSISEVSVSGESGSQARICNYDWILDIRRQCMEKDIPFLFHQTGAKLIKDGKLYRIRRKYQLSQADKANINYKTETLH